MTAADEPLPCSDEGNARRFLLLFGERVRDAGNGQWAVWRAGFWWYDRDDEVTALAAEVCHAIRAEASATADPRRRRELLAWSMRSQGRARLAAMTELARQLSPAISREHIRDGGRYDERPHGQYETRRNGR